MLDLDHFRLVNESLGPVGGDNVLRLIGDGLMRALRGADTLARFGGDEFAIILENLEGPYEAAEISARLLKLCAAPLSISDETLALTASVGIAIHPSDGDDGETLQRHADVALKQAKQRGPGSLQFFEPELEQRAVERLQLESCLRPEHTLLYQIVEQYYPAFAALMAEQERPLPDYVQREFEDSLRCGRLEHGFLRVRCDTCHAEHLVAFSGRRRGFCPSCGAQRLKRVFGIDIKSCAASSTAGTQVDIPSKAALTAAKRPIDILATCGEQGVYASYTPPTRCPPPPSCSPTSRIRRRPSPRPGICGSCSNILPRRRTSSGFTSWATVRGHVSSPRRSTIWP